MNKFHLRNKNKLGGPGILQIAVNPKRINPDLNPNVEDRFQSLPAPKLFPSRHVLVFQFFACDLKFLFYCLCNKEIFKGIGLNGFIFIHHLYEKF